MGRREDLNEKAIVRAAEALGWRCHKYKVPGEKGGYDQIMFSGPPARTIFVEVKDHNGDGLSVHQQEFRDTMTKLGYECYDVTGPLTHPSEWQIRDNWAQRVMLSIMKEWARR